MRSRTMGLRWFGNVYSPALIFFEECWDVLVVKGQAAAEEGVEDDPEGPYVHLRPRVELPRDYLRGGVVGRTAGGLQEMAVAHYVAESEVCHLHVHVRVQQKILRLEVPVHDTMPVTALHRRG